MFGWLFGLHDQPVEQRYRHADGATERGQCGGGFAARLRIRGDQRRLPGDAAIRLHLSTQPVEPARDIRSHLRMGRGPGDAQSDGEDAMDQRVANATHDRSFCWLAEMNRRRASGSRRRHQSAARVPR